MVIHIGISPNWEELSFCNKKDGSITNVPFVTVKRYHINKVNTFFKELIAKINGKPGHICICLDEQYGNEIRKEFIQQGLNYEFKDVQIINWETALYLHVSSQIKYRVYNEDIIWIYWETTFYMWEIKNGVAIFSGFRSGENWNQSDLESLLYELALPNGQDVIICSTDFDKLLFSNTLACKHFIFDAKYSDSNGSLIKAMITSGDENSIDAENYLCRKITLIIRKYSSRIEEEELIAFKYGEKLPLTHSQKMLSAYTKDELVIKTDKSKTEIVKLPPYKNILLTFVIDKNEIYSVKFEQINDEEHENNDSKELSSNKNMANRCEKDTSSTSTFSTVAALDNHFSIPTINTPINTNINATGIDLGTSRCCAAVNRKKGVITVPLDNTGERLLPSYVAYDEERTKCGQIVIDRLRHFSKSTIFDSKRIIGRNIGEIEIDLFWPFEITVDNKNVLLGVQKFNGKGTVTAEEVGTALLKHMKHKCEEFQGKKLSKAVITVPAGFTETQKAATIEAAKLAGWEEIVLLPEPIAAAFAYFMDRSLPSDPNVLLFDLGGGTLDVCIFRIKNELIEVISNTGDSKFGGRDFDTLLINYFKNALLTKYGISLVKNKKYLLMVKCQKIKENLSFIESCSLDIDDFDPSQEGLISITQDDFKNMSTPLLNKIINTINSALYNSALNASEINQVLHVGGGSRMPMVKQLLNNMFPQSEHCCEENPDEVVAIGAAYYAYKIFSEE